MEYLIAMSAVFLIFIASSKTTVIISGSYEFGIPGQPFNLTCTLTSSKTSSMSVYRPGQFFSRSVQVVGDKCYNTDAVPVLCVPSECSCINDGAGKGSQFSWIIKPDRSMDLSTWICKDFEENSSKTFTLRVAELVSSVTLINTPATGSELTLNEGTPISLVCVTSACRPSANVEWYIGNNNYTSSSSQTVKSITGNLHITTSTMTFTPDKNMNRKILKFSAYNYGDTANTVRNQTQLNVRYGPGSVQIVPTTTNYTLLEATDTLGPITCNAECNPSCTYCWLRNGINVTTDPILRINKTSRGQAGTYSCRVTNEYNTREEVSSNISLVVEYAPTNTQLVTSAGPNVTENSTITLSCTTDSVPSSTIQLIHEGNSTDVIQTEKNVLNSIFIKVISSCFDTGEYACIATNKRGNSQSTMKQLNVLCKPRLLNINYNNILVVNKADVLNIDVAFVAYPVPSFTWTFLKEEDCRYSTVLQNSTDVLILNSFNKHAVYYSKLQITNFGQKDVGRYLLRAENNIGRDEDVLFTVVFAAKPDPPTGIKAVCSKGNKAEIIWLSRYNGGNDQQFVIGVRRNTNSEYKKESQIYNDLGIYTVNTGFVDGLNEDTHYWFTIYAVNMYGSSNSTSELECDTPALNEADNGPNSTNVALLVIAILLFVGEAIGIACFFVIKRRRKASKQQKLPAPNEKAKGENTFTSYEELGAREHPVASYYQEIGLSESVSQNRTENGSEYDALGQREAPNVYDKMKRSKTTSHEYTYENTSLETF